MPAFAPDGHRSTAEDHGSDRGKSESTLAAEQCESMLRVARTIGASRPELAQLMQRLREIDHDGRSAGIVAQGNIEADRMEADIPVLDLGDGSVASLHASATRRIDHGLLETLDPAHDKKWYARWKFWSFIAGSNDPVAALVLQGLALRPSEPEDAHADLVAKSRKVLESWRRTSDPLFWTAVEAYVRQQSFSLETQIYLMHFVAAVFAGDTMKLSNAQSEALAQTLTCVWCDALGTSATMPSSDLYKRLAEGLEATDRETGEHRTLGRADAAQIALTALWTIIAGQDDLSG